MFWFNKGVCVYCCKNAKIKDAVCIQKEVCERELENARLPLCPQEGASVSQIARPAFRSTENVFDHRSGRTRSEPLVIDEGETDISFFALIAGQHRRLS